MLLVVLRMALSRMFSYDKGAIFCLSSFRVCLWYSLKYLNSEWLVESPACRRLCIFCKTGNPSNYDFSDKSGSCQVMHESFNNILIPKYAKLHELHGGVIYPFHGPLGLWNITTNVQYGGGGGLLLSMCPFPKQYLYCHCRHHS